MWWTKVQMWWTNLPSDPARPGQAQLWQTIACAGILFSLLQIPTAVITLHSRLQYVAIIWTFGSYLGGVAIAWWWIRRGNMLRCAQWMVASGLASFLPTFALYGLSKTGTIMPVLAFPVILAGLAQHRRTLIVTTGTLIAGIYFAYSAEYYHWGFVGLLSIRTLDTLDGVTVSVFLFMSLTVCIGASGKVLAQAAHLAQERARALEAMNTTLEERVTMRTAELARQTHVYAEAMHTSAHDIRHWLDDITLQVHMLQDYLPQDAPAVQDTNTLIRYGLNGTKEYLDAMIEGSKLTNNALKLKLKPTNLELVLEVTFAGLQSRFSANECTYTLHTAVCPCWINADAQATQRVIRNVVINALNFTADVDHGHVDVWITIDPEQGTTQLIVQDNGMGIEGDLLQRLAIPFTTTDGTGLGLHYCKGVMAQHPFGAFHIYSAGHGCGTTVTLTFRTVQEAFVDT